jgi:hypothetical protein
MATLRIILYPFGSAAAALLIVQLIGMLCFGTQVEQWPEWQGRVISTLGTSAGIVSAVAGLYMAVRSERRVIK